MNKPNLINNPKGLSEEINSGFKMNTTEDDFKFLYEEDYRLIEEDLRLIYKHNNLI